MKITYEKKIDAAYIYITNITPGEVKKTYLCDPIEINGIINLDFDINGVLIGIEVLDASKKLPPEILKNAVGGEIETATINP